MPNVHAIPRVSNKFFGMRDFPYLRLGIRDLKAKSGRDSGLKVCAGGGMPKVTLGIARNFGSGLRDRKTLLGTLYTGQLLHQHENHTGCGFYSHIRTADFDAISVTERSCDAPISKVSVTYRIGSVLRFGVL